MTDQTAVEAAVEVVKQPSVEQALATMITKVTDASGAVVDAGGKVVDWATVQIPEVLQQLIMWNIAVDSFNLVLFGTMLIVLGKVLTKQMSSEARANCKAKRCENWIYDRDGDCHPGAFVPAVVLAVLFFCVYVNALELIKLVVAPKVWLLEYGADLAKTLAGCTNCSK